MMIQLKKSLLESIQSVDQKASHYVFKIGSRHIGSRLPSYHWWLKTLEYSCHGIPWFALTIISLYLVPDNKSIAQLLVGLILDIIFVAVTKASTRRRRPTYARQDDQPMVISVDKHSLPSGHASRAIYVSLFFSSHSLVSILVWTWSLCVCSSRVLLGRHHLLDVFCGAFLGYLIYSLQFVILKPIDSLLLWMISALLNVTFSDTNDFD